MLAGGEVRIGATRQNAQECPLASRRRRRHVAMSVDVIAPNLEGEITANSQLQSKPRERFLWRNVPIHSVNIHRRARYIARGQLFRGSWILFAYSGGEGAPFDKILSHLYRSTLQQHTDNVRRRR